VFKKVFAVDSNFIKFMQLVRIL